MKVEIGEHVKPMMLELIKTAYEAGDAFKTAFGRAPLDMFRDVMNQNIENLKTFKANLGDALSLAESWPKAT